MTERQLQFRVGMFVIAAFAGLGFLSLRFGEMNWLWQTHYQLSVHFDSAPGIERGTPVRKNGVEIGAVRSVVFDEERGGVVAVLDIQERYSLRQDSLPSLSRSILGDAAIEFTPGKNPEFHRPGEQIEGLAAPDLMDMGAHLERAMTQTLASFAATSEEWQKLGKSANGILETQQGRLDVVVAKAAESLNEFTLTMQNANRILGDPQNAENLKVTLAALPGMVDDTRRTIHAVRSAVLKMDENLANLHAVTSPLAQRSESIVVKLDKSVGNLEALSSELNLLTRALNRKDGTLNLLMSDPQLYRHLDQSAAALETLLKNLDPVVRDVRVFTDKVARHPELIGVGGAIRGSSGLK